MSFLVVGYYTRNTLYEDMAKVFVESLKKFNIVYHIQAIEDLGDWHLNTSYKPTFLREMLDTFDQDIVYVDVDAEFFRYPYLFNEINYNIAVHYFNKELHRTVNKRSRVTGYEVLSGTVFLKNCEATKLIVENWERECKKFPYTWDQVSLAKVIGTDFYNLPEEYCTIFDVMSHVRLPVIKHYQASRVMRRMKQRRRA